MTMEDERFERRSGSGSSPKLAVAESEVARAKAKLDAELRTVSRAGRRLARSVVRGVRPALIGVAVVTGVGLVVAVWRRRQSRRGALRSDSVHAPSSVWWELGRTAVIALASSAGKHLAAKLVEPPENAEAESRQVDSAEPPALERA
jgi:hypothetical protein